MEKPARTEFEIHSLLARRWSPRSFNEKPIKREVVARLFEAARWAPSASNEQPWSFIIGFHGDETFTKIFNALVEFNQLWAGNSSLLIVALARKISEKTGKLNPWYCYDVGQAVAHLTFQAMHEGLYVHQMGGFESPVLVKELEIPHEYEPLTVIAIGYQGDYTTLHPNLQALEISERTRKPQSAFVFHQKFGKPFQISNV